MSNNTTEKKDNKMGTMPINRLLVSMSLPMMISMFVQALYNIVDSMFVAKVGEEALTAVSVAFPIQMLMIAIGAGTGVGINALLSRSLGEKNYKEVNRAATNGIFLVLVSYIIFALFGLFLSNAYFCSQTTDALIIEYGTSYLKICTVFSAGIFMQMTMERLLQSTGRTFYTMITQCSGAIINIILNPILVFGLFGVPKLGVTGSAMATVTGQSIAAVMAVIFNIKKNHDLKIEFRGFRPNGKTIKSIYRVGIPAIIMQAIGSVMTFGMNKILMPFSSTAVSVFGVYFKLNSFIFMPIFGLNNGMIPIVAYNYGARNKERIIKTIKLGMKISFAMMTIGLIIFQTIPDKLLMIFSASENMLSIGVPALRIISLSFLFAGISIIIMAVFQSFGEGIYSLIVSAVRQLLVILPVAYVLAHVFGLAAIWWAIPFAELFSISLSLLFLRKLYHNKIKSL